MLRASKRDGGDCAVSDLWCQEKRLQDIVVRLRGGDSWLMTCGRYRPGRNSQAGKEIKRTLLAYQGLRVVRLEVYADEPQDGGENANYNKV